MREPAVPAIRLAAAVMVSLSLRALPTAAQTAAPLASHAPIASAPSSPRPHVTFSDQVVRLLQAHCQGCHHDGGIAPFPLVTYDDAYEHRLQIQSQTTARKMPPWKAEASCSSFEGDPTLSDADVRTFDLWAQAGAPEGSRALLPPPLAFDDGWELGAPDLELALPRPFLPDFSKGDVYRCFRLETGLSSQRYLSAVEVMPGNRTMVHHVLLFADTTNASAALDGKDGQPGYPCFGGPGFNAVSPLGAWVPGFRNSFLPDGIGIDLPAGAPVVIQVHYSARTGSVAPDLTRTGLHFSRTPVQKRLLTLPLVNQAFLLPAGQSGIPVTASYGPTPAAITLRRIAPHMHLLGKTMSVSTAPPAGAPQCLVNVADWDFHWQGFYAYRSPVKIPLFSTISLLATYDNSPANPDNPNVPPKDVRWGDATSDEMCLCYLSFTLDAENLTGAAGLAPTDLSTFDPFWERAWAEAAAARPTAAAPFGP